MSTGVLGSPMDPSDPARPIKVLIVDDHAVVRQSLRTFLEVQDDPSTLPIEVVGEAAKGVEAVDLARRLQPDVVMPEVDGVQAVRQIIENGPGSRVIILTSFGEEDKVHRRSKPAPLAICSRT